VFKIIRNDWPYLLVAPLLLSAFLTSFLRSNDIPLLSPEALTSYSVLILTGFFLGMVMVFGGGAIRVLTAATIVGLFIFNQIDRLPYGLHARYVMPLSILIISVVLYLLRQHLDKLLIVVFGVFWIGSFFTPTTPFITKQKFNVPNNEENRLLPPYIHIILDEHIGIEGIPPSEDQNLEFSHALRDKYIQLGFQVYGRAYSRHFSSQNSFASFMNFDSTNEPQKYYKDGENGYEYNLTSNALFEALSSRGYHINVVQPKYMDLCNGDKKNVVENCITYEVAALLPLGPSNGFSAYVLTIITNVFVKLEFNNLYEIIKKTSIGKALDLPNIGGSTPPFATYKVFDEVVDLLSNAQKGNAYFVHLLLPHFPFLFDEQCNNLGPRGIRVSQKRNHPEAKESVYSRYLKQVKCTHHLMEKLLRSLSDNQATSQSTIVIHGDHGSRILNDGQEFDITSIEAETHTREELIQMYSTFFVIRRPGRRAGYDSRPLPLDYLLANIVFGREIPSQANDLAFVYIPDSDKSSMKRLTLSPFTEGLPTASW